MNRKIKLPKFSHQQSIIIIAIASITIVVAIILLGISSIQRIQNIQSHWAVYSTKSAESAQTLDRIRQHFGYGGFIHHFKNLVLRQEPSLMPRIEADIEAIEKAIQKYKSLQIDKAELDALNKIETTIREYKNNYELAKEMIQSDATPKEIDIKVKVNDQPAFEALHYLANVTLEKLENKKRETESAINETVKLILSGSILILIVIIAGILFINFIKRLYQATQEIEQKQAFIETILSSTPAAILGIDTESNIVLANQQAEILLGQPRQKLIGLPITTFLPENLDDKFTQHQVDDPSDSKKQQGHIYNEQWLINNTGNKIPVSINQSHIETIDDGIEIIVISDLTEHYESKKKLRISEDNLKKAQALAHTGSWVWDLKNDQQKWSHEVYNILGKEPGSIKEGLNELLSFIPDDERSNVRETIQSTIRDHNSYSIEYQVVREDGSIRHIRELGDVIEDELGRPSSLHGALQDITDLKQAQTRLSQAAVAFENTNDAIVVSDVKNNIIAINRAYTEITGYEEHEIVGKNPRTLKSGKHDKAFYDAMWKSIVETGTWQGEIWDRRKDGILYPKWLTINTIKDDFGHITNYVGVFTDITKLKESQDKLEYLAHHDALTKLPNRLLFTTYLNKAIQHAKRRNTNIAVMFMDLDRFKSINDGLGHPAGDELLQTVASRLLECVRSEDTIARLGGCLLITSYSQLGVL